MKQVFTYRDISSIAIAYAKQFKPAPPNSTGTSTASNPNSPIFLTCKINANACLTHYYSSLPLKYLLTQVITSSYQDIGTVECRQGFTFIHVYIYFFTLSSIV